MKITGRIFNQTVTEP